MVVGGLAHHHETKERDEAEKRGYVKLCCVVIMCEMRHGVELAKQKHLHHAWKESKRGRRSRATQDGKLGAGAPNPTSGSEKCFFVLQRSLCVWWVGWECWRWDEIAGIAELS